ncbi:hypothetical protein TNCV_4382361 [Trichonephila clavipes]|nr:hypothetical protein TNCV_4382361 [Trichonephila clavipes]
MNSITERRVIHQVKIDPKISAPKIAASTSNTLGRSVSAETVRRVLRKAGYNGRVARKKPLIENLWSHLERAVQKHRITSKEQLKLVLQEELLNIASETTRRLVESMPRQLEAVISAKGERLTSFPKKIQPNLTRDLNPNPLGYKPRVIATILAGRPLDSRTKSPNNIVIKASDSNRTKGRGRFNTTPP